MILIDWMGSGARTFLSASGVAGRKKADRNVRAPSRAPLRRGGVLWALVTSLGIPDGYDSAR